MNEKARRALQAVVDTVNATGGIVRHRDGTSGCAADEDWLDLAEAYLLACQALGATPQESLAATE